MNLKLVAFGSLAAFSLLVVACSGTTSSESNAPQNDGTDSEDELRKASCKNAGGTCKGLSPSSCGTSDTDPAGHWGNANDFSCGRAVGVGCCLPSCPQLSPPAPGFCAGGQIVPRKNKAGCTSGFDCVLPDAGPLDAGPTDMCTPAGGACVGLAPSSCGTGPFDPAGHWGAAETFSCGGALGVGCCLPACPELSPPPPGFCDGGPTHPIVNAAGCTVGFDCN